MKQLLKIAFLFSFSFLFIFLFSEVSIAAMATHNYTNPLADGAGPVTSFSRLFGNLLAAIQGAVGWLAVMMIVIGGLIYITSGGSVKQATLGRTTVIYAMVGFAIAISAPSLLREVREIASAGVGGGPSIIATATPVAEIIGNVMNFLLTAIGMLALIGFIIGGILYIAAGGDVQKADRAKKAILYSIIALTISGAALIILRQVIQILET